MSAINLLQVDLTSSHFPFPAGLQTPLGVATQQSHSQLQDGGDLGR